MANHEPNRMPQVAARNKHPDEWKRDLSPDPLAGQNIGARSPDARRNPCYASDVKELTRDLDGFTLDELRHIPVLEPGERLKQGATYLDVTDPKRPVYEATGDLSVPRDHYFVPKSAVHYEYWNRLRERPSA